MLLLILLLAPAGDCLAPSSKETTAVEGVELRTGDLVFHHSRSRQSEVVRLVTGSTLTHMGVVLVRDGVAWIYEAVQPVKCTPYAEWKARGRAGRLEHRRATGPLDLAALRAEGRRHLGKDYDLRFEADAARMYCSELAWLMLKAAGVEVGAWQPWSSLDLQAKATKALAQKRLGHLPPPTTKVITPKAMFDAARPTAGAGN